jgi:hypothetical protein
MEASRCDVLLRENVLPGMLTCRILADTPSANPAVDIA